MSPQRGYLDPQPPSGPLTSRSISDLHTDASVVNSTAASTLATIAMPKTVAAGDHLRLIFSGDLLNNSGSAANYTFTLTLGATTLHTLGAFSISAASSRRTWRIEHDLLIAGTADERSTAQLLISSAGAAAVSQHGMGRIAAAEDLTVGKNLTLTVTMGTAAATIDCYLHETDLCTLKR